MKMYAPAGVTSASIGSTCLVFEDDGSVDVSYEDAQLLKSHGFTESAPVVVASEKEQRKIDKAKAKAKAEYDAALAQVQAANAAVLDVEGRGSEEDLASAHVALEAAQSALAIAEAAL